MKSIWREITPRFINLHQAQPTIGIQKGSDSLENDPRHQLEVKKMVWRKKERKKKERKQKERKKEEITFGREKNEKKEKEKDKIVI